MINLLNTTPVDLPDSADQVLRLEYASKVDGLNDWAFLQTEESADVWAVVLHGHGSHGDQLFSRPDIRGNWLPALQAKGLGILCPNLRDNAWMNPAAVEDLKGLLGYVRETYGAERFVFASGSMGGTGNLIYAVQHPQDVAGIVSLGAAVDLTEYHAWCRRSNDGIRKEIADAIESSFGGKPEELPEVFDRSSALLNRDRLTMPVFLAHGQADATMPVEPPRMLAEKMGERDTFRFREIPEGNHDSPLSSMAEGLEWVMRLIG